MSDDGKQKIQRCKTIQQLAGSRESALNDLAAAEHDQTGATEMLNTDRMRNVLCLLPVCARFVGSAVVCPVCIAAACAARLPRVVSEW